MNFKIEEKKHELTEGYFMLIMKYSVIILTSWMFGQLIIYTYPCLAWDGEKYPPFLKFLNDYHILSWILVFTSIAWYSHKKIKNYQLGLIVELNDNNQEKNIELTLIHPLHGKSKQISIDNNKLTIQKNIQKSKWTGEFDSYFFFNNNKLITILNPTRSAWKLNSNFEDFIHFLDSKAKTI
jgi:hypothetical protein